MLGTAAGCFGALLLAVLGASPEWTALRNWQLGALAVAAAAALAPARTSLDGLLSRSVRSPLILIALGTWMLGGELLNFQAFRVNAFDFGVFDGMLESTHRGRFLYSPIYEVSHFGVHQTWWMLPLVPLHWVWRSPSLLLVVNVTLLLGAAALLIRLARRFDPDLAPLAAIALLTCPWVARLFHDGFRPESADTLPRPLCVQASVFPQLSDLPGIELLGPSCRARPGSHLLIHAALPAWPESSASLRALAERPGARALPGGFVLVPGDVPGPPP